MRRFVTMALVMSMLLLLLCSCGEFSKDLDKIGNVQKSVVKLSTYDHEGNAICTGSGFVVYNDTTIVTNYHVISDAYSCDIETENDELYRVSDIICFSKEKDLAILQLNRSSGLTPLVLGDSSKVQKGEVVTAIGSPLGLINTISQGIISGRVTEEGQEVFQFSASISNGSSGGALFNERGEIIGVTFASYKNGQSLNLAIPINEVKSLYTSGQESIALSDYYFMFHPYAESLIKHKDAITVTIDDLKKYPNSYDGKTVRIESTVSSISEDYTYLGLFIYISNIRCSNDAHEDENYNVAYHFEDCSLLEINAYEYGSVKKEYVDPEIRAGDKVVVIGVFEYTPAGWVKGAMDSTYYNEKSDGMISAYAVIKK